MKKSDRIPVLVTGVGGGGHGAQILKALRLAQTNYEIVGTDISPNSTGLKLVDHAYLVPPANDDSYIGSLLELCRRHDVVAAFHGSEPELRVLSRNRECFSTENILLPINPARTIELCMDKLKTSQFLLEAGFPVPRFALLQTRADIESFDCFPVVIKPHIGGGGSSNVYIAQNPQQLAAITDYLSVYTDSFYAQEYVGTPDTEFTVGVLCDFDDGEVINSIAVHRNVRSALSSLVRVKNVSGRAELGTELIISSGISQGAIGKFPEVTETCEKIAREIGARGAVNIQCRSVDSQVFTFEINPRFSGTTSLRAMVGYNEPDILIRKHLFGEVPQRGFAFSSGHIARGLSETLIDNSISPKPVL